MHHVDERFLQTEGGGQEGKMHFLLLLRCWFAFQAGGGAAGPPRGGRVGPGG